MILVYILHNTYSQYYAYTRTTLDVSRLNVSFLFKKSPEQSFDGVDTAINVSNEKATFCCFIANDNLIDFNGSLLPISYQFDRNLSSGKINN